jgi:hypothetical protein
MEIKNLHVATIHPSAHLPVERQRIKCKDFTFLFFRACLAGLRLRQTNFEDAAPPICNTIVEPDSQFGAGEMCLAKITAPTPKTEIML